MLLELQSSRLKRFYYTIIKFNYVIHFACGLTPCIRKKRQKEARKENHQQNITLGENHPFKLRTPYLAHYHSFGVLRFFQLLTSPLRSHNDARVQEKRIASESCKIALSFPLIGAGDEMETKLYEELKTSVFVFLYLLLFTIAGYRVIGL